MNLGGTVHFNKKGICIIIGVVLIFCLYVLSSNKKETVEASNKVNLRRLLEIAIKAAENGGLEVVSVKDNLQIKSKGLTKEGMVDSVTTADFLSHCAMVATLKHSLPELNVISEEAKTACDKSQEVDLSDSPDSNNLTDSWVNLADLTVWIDPLDATHEYTEKLYKYVTTMVCVAYRGVPVIGVIHRPFSKETSWAWVKTAKSADLSKPLKPHDSDKVRIIISRSHSGEIQKVLNENFKNYELVIAAGAGYKALEVVTGQVDAYLHTTAIKKWDLCAGNAIINAAGGRMTTKFNKVIDYTNMDNVKNEDGLVATLTNHELYIGKL